MFSEAKINAIVHGNISFSIELVYSVMPLTYTPTQKINQLFYKKYYSICYIYLL